MKRSVGFLTLLLIACSAEAGVYKCATPDGTVYSEHPCANDAKTVEHLAKKPSNEDAFRAQMRLRNDIREVATKERQEQMRRDHPVVVIGAPEPVRNSSR